MLAPLAAQIQGWRIFLIRSEQLKQIGSRKAAPQTAHYLRGDKFEKPMGKIVQARAQVKLSGYPSGNSRPACTLRCRLMKNSLSLVFALGQISKQKMGYAFYHFED
jgi:hypothetical protein